MKSINKLLLSISVILAVALSACEEGVERDPSPQANPNSNKVYFPQQESKLVLPIDASSVEVTIARLVTTSDLTVNLHLSGSESNLFSIPKSVNFAAGEAEKTFEVTWEALELMKSYLFSIEIDANNQLSPYAKDSIIVDGKKIPIYSVVAFNILKEDFAPYSMGDYYSAWWDEEWEAMMEYSPATEQYRIKEFCGYAGYDAYFKWDGETKVTMVGGSKVGSRTGFQTGEVDPTYGMVYASFSDPEGPFEYDPETKTFTFGYAWRVTAGSFGMYEDFYTITSLF